MNHDLLINQNTALNELQFRLAGDLYKDDIQKMFDAFMKNGLDRNSLGFWIWDLKKGIELYSPNIRKSLQYNNEIDFPNIPKSWMDAIFPEDYELAIENFDEHVRTKGEHKYFQKVRYYKKIKGILKVICHGLVVHWEGDEAVVMIGVHMNPNGKYIKSKYV